MARAVARPTIPPPTMATSTCAAVMRRASIVDAFATTRASPRARKDPPGGLTFEGLDLKGPIVEKVALGRCDGPLLLAFPSEGSDFVVREAELARIRAELRGLGATLVVVSAESVWQFRPDDDVEHFERRLHAAAEVEKL